MISVQEAARLVTEGAEEIGTQWVEVDRNEKIRIESEQAGESKHVPMNLKSRPVARGNQEKRELHSDGPTADAEGIHLVFSFASSRKAKVMCGDLESAYFTGERMSRVLLLRQPRSGLPGLKPDDRSRVSSSREQITIDEEKCDGSSSCFCKQGPPIYHEDSHLRFDVSDGSHQLALW